MVHLEGWREASNTVSLEQDMGGKRNRNVRDSIPEACVWLWCSRWGGRPVETWLELRKWGWQREMGNSGAWSEAHSLWHFWWLILLWVGWASLAGFEKQIIIPWFGLELIPPKTESRMIRMTEKRPGMKLFELAMWTVLDSKHRRVVMEMFTSLAYFETEHMNPLNGSYT